MAAVSVAVLVVVAASVAVAVLDEDAALACGGVAPITMARQIAGGAAAIIGGSALTIDTG